MMQQADEAVQAASAHAAPAADAGMRASKVLHMRRLAGDELGLLPPVFAHAFGQPIGLDVLRWKYATGLGESWLAQAADGRPLMHCGLLFRDVRFAGQGARMAQLVDLAAGSDKTGLARRNGSFSQLMHHLLDRLPRADNPHGLALGFPSGRAMRLGEHLGVYQSVDQVYDLKFVPAPRHNWLGLRCQLLDALPEARVLNALWHSMARELADAAVGVRDATYMHWRFVRHPQRLSYRLLLCQSAIWRKPCALLVLRWGDEGVCHLIDVLGPPSALPDVLTALRAWCSQQALHEIRLALTGRFAQQLAPLAAECTASEIRIMANPRTPPEVLAHFQNNWWLMLGDTDYR
ncbi:MAG: hypothetical protein Q4A28_03910 [Brachymonas sp.]|nr:hypothetical protein [Brachymonas sp.]